MLRFLTAGESHGQGLVTILEGLPAGLAIDFDAITQDLRRRQGGYGRGRRMAIESDRARVPVAACAAAARPARRSRCWSRNKDWENWQNTMHVEARGAGRMRPAPIARRWCGRGPGHADLAGALKYDHDDIRDVLERASARETAARVAAGAVARQLLRAVGCEITSHVTGIGDVVVPAEHAGAVRRGARPRAGCAAALRRHRRSSGR